MSHEWPEAFPRHDSTDADRIAELTAERDALQTQLSAVRTSLAVAELPVATKMSPERLAQIRTATHGDGPVPSAMHALLMAAQLVDELDRQAEGMNFQKDRADRMERERDEARAQAVPPEDIADARAALVARRKLLGEARRIVDAIHLRELIPRGGFVITLEGEPHMGDVFRLKFQLMKELDETEEPAIVREVKP